MESANNFADRIRPFFTGEGKKRALAAGFTAEAIRLWLKGSYLPNNKSLKRIADFTGKDVNWLLGGRGQAEEPRESEGISWELKALVRSLQSNIDALTDRVNALKNYTEAQEARLLEQKKYIDTITAALIQAERQKDFLPLKILTGGMK
jgi:hypothetical protein